MPQRAHGLVVTISAPLPVEQLAVWRCLRTPSGRATPTAHPTHAPLFLESAVDEYLRDPRHAVAYRRGRSACFQPVEADFWDRQESPEGVALGIAL